MPEIPTVAVVSAARKLRRVFMASMVVLAARRPLFLVSVVEIGMALGANADAGTASMVNKVDSDFILLYDSGRNLFLR